MAKKRINLKMKSTVYDLSDKFYYSGFCFTDNTNFSHFYVKKFPKLGLEFKKFVFEEKDLIFDIDIEEQPMVQQDHIKFENGIISKEYYDYFKNQFATLKFFRLREFMNEPVRMKILVFDDDNGKAVGILNLKPHDERRK